MNNTAQKPGHKMRRLVVAFLERLCELLDDIPRISRVDHSTWKVDRFGKYGCKLDLVGFSKRLDHRWGTRYWEEL